MFKLEPDGFIEDSSENKGVWVSNGGRIIVRDVEVV
jgi:hypothetical protein